MNQNHLLKILPLNLMYQIVTTDFAVLGKLNFNTKNKKPKNIYWNYHKNTATIKWIDDNTVIINNHKLNILKDTFNFRRNK